jgi:hypothetical protein
MANDCCAAAATALSELTGDPLDVWAAGVRKAMAAAAKGGAL